MPRAVTAVVLRRRYHRVAVLIDELAALAHAPPHLLLSHDRAVNNYLVRSYVAYTEPAAAQAASPRQVFQAVPHLWRYLNRTLSSRVLLPLCGASVFIPQDLHRQNAFCGVAEPLMQIFGAISLSMSVKPLVVGGTSVMQLSAMVVLAPPRRAPFVCGTTIMPPGVMHARDVQQLLSKLNVVKPPSDAHFSAIASIHARMVGQRSHCPHSLVAKYVWACLGRMFPHIQTDNNRRVYVGKLRAMLTPRWRMSGDFAHRSVTLPAIEAVPCASHASRRIRQFRRDCEVILLLAIIIVRNSFVLREVDGATVAFTHQFWSQVCEEAIEKMVTEGKLFPDKPLDNSTIVRLRFRAKNVEGGVRPIVSMPRPTGFRSLLSTINGVLQERMNSHLDRRSVMGTLVAWKFALGRPRAPVSIVSIDLKDCYSRFSLPAVMQRLSERSSAATAERVHYSFQNVLLRFRKQHFRLVGLPQGSVYSTTLTTLYLERLQHAVTSEMHRKRVPESDWLLVRMVDDLLFLSANQATADYFRQFATSAELSRDLHIETQLDKGKEKALEQYTPFLGFQINSDLEIRVLWPKRLTRDTTPPSLKTVSNSLMEAFFYRWDACLTATRFVALNVAECAAAAAWKIGLGSLKTTPGSLHALSRQVAMFGSRVASVVRRDIMSFQAGTQRNVLSAQYVESVALMAVACVIYTGNSYLGEKLHQRAGITPTHFQEVCRSSSLGCFRCLPGGQC